MQKFVVLLLSVSVIFLLGTVTAGPIGQQSYNESVVPYQPLNSSLQWASNHVFTVATGFVGTVGALVLLIVLFQPMLIYNVCYALGGCQDTLDNYLDSLLGEARNSRRAKRDLENTDLDYAMRILKMAVQFYGPNSLQNEVQESANHQVERRSPMDYIEPVLVMMSKMYSEFVDEEQKKNFNKPPSIR